MLFPAIQPDKTWHFSVSDTHTLYIEESGNPEGVPVVFLHGGPGGIASRDTGDFLIPKIIALFYSINEVAVNPGHTLRWMIILPGTWLKTWKKFAPTWK